MLHRTYRRDEAPQSPVLELYDLQRDPEERHNIAAANRPMVNYLQGFALHEYKDLVPPKTGMLSLHTVSLPSGSESSHYHMLLYIFHICYTENSFRHKTTLYCFIRWLYFSPQQQGLNSSDWCLAVRRHHCRPLPSSAPRHDIYYGAFCNFQCRLELQH